MVGDRHNDEDDKQTDHVGKGLEGQCRDQPQHRGDCGAGWCAT